MKKFVLSEVAARVGVQPYRITYAISTGKIQDPERVGGRRVFREAEVRVIEQLFSKKKGGEK